MAKLNVTYRNEDKRFVVECDDYPLCVEGDTITQVMDRMQEAVKQYRRTFRCLD